MVSFNISNLVLDGSSLEPLGLSTAQVVEVGWAWDDVPASTDDFTVDHTEANFAVDSGRDETDVLNARPCAESEVEPILPLENWNSQDEFIFC